jgi:hypothetical protein
MPKQTVADLCIDFIIGSSYFQSRPNHHLVPPTVIHQNFHVRDAQTNSREDSTFLRRFKCTGCEVDMPRRPVGAPVQRRGK